MKRTLILVGVLVALVGSAQADNVRALRDSINYIRDGRDVMPHPKATQFSADTINERTAGSGVTIDGLLIKDGAVGGSSTTQTVGVLTVTTLGVTGATALGGTVAAGRLTVTTNIFDAGGLQVMGASVLSNAVYMGNAASWVTVTVDGNFVNTITALGVTTNDQVLGGLGTFVTTAPTTAVTNTIANPTTPGRVMTIVSVGAGETYLVDGANLKLEGNWEAGQYDSITLRAIDASTWVESGRANN